LPRGGCLPKISAERRRGYRAAERVRAQSRGRITVKTASRRTKVLIVVVTAGLLLTTDAFATGFSVRTNLTIRAPRHVQSGHAFRINGFLQSSKHFCRASSRIVLVKVGAGVVARKRTTRRGHYSFRQRIHGTTTFVTRFDGKTRGVHPNIRTCRWSHSRRRTVHAR
jgi:hypothetical protein